MLAAAALVACTSPKPYEIPAKDRARFGKDVIDVPMPGKPPLIEGIENCVVWKAQYTGDRITGWKAALGADWGGSYPAFMTGCVRQSIEFKDKRVMVYLCAQAIGAGGGCANGGLYWSYTGERPWRTSDDGGAHWYPLPH